VEIDAESEPRGDREQRVLDVMAAANADLDGRAAAVDQQLDALASGGRRRRERAKGAVAPDENLSTGKTLRDRDESAIGRAYDQNAARTKAERKLCLGGGYVFERADAFEVSRSDVGNYADVRARDLRKPPDFAWMIHAHLEHGEILVAAQSKQRQRKPD